jgi:HKD family nuclease
MRIEFINNAGIQNMKHQLEEEMKSCKSFSIASAFITSGSLEVLDIFIKKNRYRFRGGRLIISLYQAFNSKEILTSLNILNNRNQGKISIAISKNKQFHWKYYSFESEKKLTTFIGSSNFTTSGMEDPGELMSKITLANKDRNKQKDLLAVFNYEWENSIPINEFPIDKYVSSAMSLRNGLSKLHPDILSLLKWKSQGKDFAEVLPGIIIVISGYLSESTTKIISKNQSHWDKNNWDCFGGHLTKGVYDRLASVRFIVIIEKYSGKYSFYISTIKGRCPLITKDGKYFIAHKKITKKKSVTPKIDEIFMSLGIRYRSPKFKPKNLSKKKAQIVKDILS